ncbi:unnamed protein product [Phytophthora fragariaefolia]|uniref:Unnamed protein product n=1 Tax=Phytophthora fragariaefolia TaxID=1490495 RepID=A0A9W6WUX4_9STRA|nr:unnamed protein product [Phytophthora fragariaefolia]
MNNIVTYWTVPGWQHTDGTPPFGLATFRFRGSEGPIFYGMENSPSANRRHPDLNERVALTHCTPTDASNDHTYLKPGKTKKDKRGVDFFVGEKGLMGYLDRVDLGKNLWLLRDNILVFNVGEPVSRGAEESGEAF